jgi:hypothetical protein
MRILVAEDSKAIGGESLDLALCAILADRGHDVVLFNGRTRAGKPVRSSSAAALLVQMCQQRPVEGLVLDLHFFQDSWYVIDILRVLQKNGGCLGAAAKIVAYSRFLEETNPNYRDIIKSEFGVPETQMFDRLTTNIRTIADQFGAVGTVRRRRRSPQRNPKWRMWYDLVTVE